MKKEEAENLLLIAILGGVQVNCNLTYEEHFKILDITLLLSVNKREDAHKLLIKMMNNEK